MLLVPLMKSSASESKPVRSVHRRYSRLSKAGRMAEPFQIKEAVPAQLIQTLKVRLMKSSASEPGLTNQSLVEDHDITLINQTKKQHMCCFA